MSYLNIPAEADSDPEVEQLYQNETARWGYVPNYTKPFALRPAVYAAWGRLNATIKAGMSVRRYELATLAAARRLRSSYCSLAHGMVLRDQFHDAETVYRIAADHHDADLDPTDIAIMDFAEKVAGDPTSITAEDIDVLRRHGLSDADIFQVVLAAAARCFFSTVIDAVGTEPDARYRTTLEPELQKVLTVGRPIAAAPAVAEDHGSR
jgi:uncharacterized peroxidase-related enzyme